MNIVVQTSGGGSGRRESAPALLAGYENLLAHLKSQGALLNAVKPELLLDIADFRSALAFAHNNAMHHDMPQSAACCLYHLYPVSQLARGAAIALAAAFQWCVFSLSNCCIQQLSFSVSMHACNLVQVSRSAPDLYLEDKEKLMLLDDHNASLLRQQPRAMCPLY